MRAPDQAKLRGVPAEFREAVTRALGRGDRAMLGLLGEEVTDLDWEESGRRLVGRAQFDLEADRGAGVTWAAILERKPDDSEANLKLGTIHRRLGDPGARAALAGPSIPEVADAPAEGARYARRVIVFAGHRIDTPERPRPRFPQAQADAARAALRARALEEKRLATGPVEGIAGGASGGDILFHEVCAEPEVAIPTRLFLALPVDLYAARSVQDAGPGWLERYRALCRRLTPTILAESEELPAWLAPKRGYTIWNRNNLWLLHAALAREDAEITLIVLWDGKGGDGPGGTADMVRLAKSRGVKVVRLDPRAP